MQYFHGISAATGKPFSPPLAFKIMSRKNPGKLEKKNIQQGHCHKCSKWVAVEGVKAGEVKVPEIYWYVCRLDIPFETEKKKISGGNMLHLATAILAL